MTGPRAFRCDVHDCGEWASFFEGPWRDPASCRKGCGRHKPWDKSRECGPFVAPAPAAAPSARPSLGSLL